MLSCALIKDVSEEETMHSVQSISQHPLWFASIRLFIYNEVHLVCNTQYPLPVQSLSLFHCFLYKGTKVFMSLLFLY